MYYLNWMWKSIASIRIGILIAVIFMLIEMGAGIGATYMQKFIIDEVFILGQFHLLPLYLSLFALAFVVSAAFNTIAPYRYVSNEYRVMSSMLSKMLRHFFRIPLKHINNERTARYVEYITSDMHYAGTMIGYHSPIGVQRVLQVLVLMVIVGWYSWPLLLSVTLLSTTYIWGGQYFAKRVKAVNREVMDRQTSLAVHLEEGVSATREIIAYHRTEWESKLYQALYEDYFTAVMKETKVQNKQLMFRDPLRWATTLSVLGFGGYQLFTNQVSLGAFVIVFQFTNQLMDSFNRLFRYGMDLTAMLPSIDRIDLLMKEEQVDPGSASLDEPIKEICFQQVGFEYKDGDRPVLQKLTFDIPTGKKIAFVGASGGGKSTIAQLFMRFFEPTEGKIVVNGIPLHRIEREDWINRVRIVFQDPYLMADTIRANLTFGREDLSEDELEAACHAAQLYEDIAQLPNQYDEEIGERGVQLSGGQKQRLAIARAILSDPEVLILDEATSSLDLETERRLQAELDELRYGKTTIIIAHRLSTVRNADLIFVMDDGRIVERGTHVQLMEHGSLYPSLVAAQPETLY